MIIIHYAFESIDSIQTFTGPVCSYEITSSSTADTTTVVPLSIEVTDRTTGVAIIRVKDGVRLDCSVPEYLLSIVAVRCDDGAKSERFVHNSFNRCVYVWATVIILQKRLNYIHERECASG